LFVGKLLGVAMSKFYIIRFYLEFVFGKKGRCVQVFEALFQVGNQPQIWIAQEFANIGSFGDCHVRFLMLFFDSYF
jgi:hypothetical protein